MTGAGNLRNDRAHADACHERWLKVLNREQGSSRYRDEWYAEQCGACRFYVPLSGQFESDWGACTNAESPFDRSVMFEHDGCNQFAASNGWYDSDEENVKGTVEVPPPPKR